MSDFVTNSNKLFTVLVILRSDDTPLLIPKVDFRYFAHILALDVNGNHHFAPRVE